VTRFVTAALARTLPLSHSGSSTSSSKGSATLTSAAGRDGTPVPISVSVSTSPFTRTPPRSGATPVTRALDQSISESRASSCAGSCTLSRSTASAPASALSFVEQTSTNCASSAGIPAACVITFSASSVLTRTARLTDT
jgi:hypothetical protein